MSYLLPNDCFKFSSSRDSTVSLIGSHTPSCATSGSSGKSLVGLLVASRMFSTLSLQTGSLFHLNEHPFFFFGWITLRLSTFTAVDVLVRILSSF